jgi:hypothetical protein
MEVKHIVSENILPFRALLPGLFCTAAADAVVSEKEALQEGDIARRPDFEPLVSLETTLPLGPMGAAQLVPWVPPYGTKCLVAIADPRKQSGDLRQTILYLNANLEDPVLALVMVVSADTVGDTKK